MLVKHHHQPCQPSIHVVAVCAKNATVSAAFSRIKKSPSLIVWLYAWVDVDVDVDVDYDSSININHSILVGYLVYSTVIRIVDFLGGIFLVSLGGTLEAASKTLPSPWFHSTAGSCPLWFAVAIGAGGGCKLCHCCCRCCATNDVHSVLACLYCLLVTLEVLPLVISHQVLLLHRATGTTVWNPISAQWKHAFSGAAHLRCTGTRYDPVHRNRTLP